MTKIRIKDIAQQAGVSIGTVDRVLHNRGEVAAQTREKILHIAAEMRYQPNLLARALTTRKSYSLAVLLPRGSADNIYWLKHPDGIKKAIQELQPFRVEVQFFYFELHNESDFLARTHEIIKVHPDGVIMAPILKKESAGFCKNLDTADIPYIFIDTLIQDTNPLTFIGEDGWQSGRVAASLLDYGLLPHKDILIVNIAKDLENTQHLNSRNQGFQSYFLDTGKNSGLKISVEIPSPNREEVIRKLEPIFHSHHNIGGIYVSSAKTHVIARYLEQTGHKDIVLIGHEMTRNNIDYMKKGIIRFLIGQRPAEQAEKALKKMFDYLSNNAVPEKKENQPIDILNTENSIYF